MVWGDTRLFQIPLFGFVNKFLMGGCNIYALSVFIYTRLPVATFCRPQLHRAWSVIGMNVEAGKEGREVGDCLSW